MTSEYTEYTDAWGQTWQITRRTDNDGNPYYVGKHGSATIPGDTRTAVIDLIEAKV